MIEFKDSMELGTEPASVEEIKQNLSPTQIEKAGGLKELQLPLKKVKLNQTSTAYLRFKALTPPPTTKG
jgi:hypothetical protein